MNALIQTLGGVGLFLFGMALMTSGLRKLAGDRLRHWLARSTRNTLSGVVTGAGVTALIQSSSATTLAAIGFVGAGLISFTASLGIIFGANIGTTITGWMVALLGFKLQLAEVALPFLFVAAIFYLFKQHRLLHGFGKALAGFCLIFIGISYLQTGLGEYQHVIDLSHWRISSFGGRIVLVSIGVVLTMITQSSSATVATALTALNASLLDLPQAAAVIIGADIGTTGTAALATIGSTTAARRTGFAHVIYNLMTGIVAFFILPLYLFIVDRIWPEASTGSAEVVAVGFHSFFNTLGVVLVLPFTKPFGQLIERIFPERADPLAALFDKKLLEDPGAALAGLQNGARQLAGNTLQHAGRKLDPGLEGGIEPITDLTSILAAIDLGQEFAVKVGRGRTDEAEIDAEQVFACIHLLDHTERLAERSRDMRRADFATKNSELAEQARAISKLARDLAGEMMGDSAPDTIAENLSTAARELEEDKMHFRQRMIRAAAVEEGMPGDEMDHLLDAHRWLRRMTYHAARIGHYAAILGESREHLRPNKKPPKSKV